MKLLIAEVAEVSKRLWVFFVKVFHNRDGGFGCWLDRFISVTGLDKL